MTTYQRTLFAALASTLLLTSALAAGSDGQLLVTVVDAAGAPVLGAKVAVTRPGTGARQEKASDAKGQAMLLIVDASEQYQLRVEKEGYQPFDGPIKPKPENTLRVTVTLGKEAAPVATPPPPTAHDKAIAAFNEGVAALQKGDVAGGLPHLQQAAALDPQLPEAQLAIAEVELDLKHGSEALAAADRYLALRPGDAGGLLVRYDALVAAGDSEKARAAIAALLAADPKDVESAIRFFNAGAERTRAGDFDAATALFEGATKIAPDDPRFAKAHYVLGTTYAGQPAKKAQAIEHLEKFLQLAPNDTDAAAAREMVAYLKK